TQHRKNAVGAEVLRASLLATKSPYTLVILHTPTVSESVVENLRRLENVQVVPVAWLHPRPDQATSYAFDRFKDVWTKLRVFKLTVYDTVAFLASDMLVTQNMDERRLRHSPRPSNCSPKLVDMATFNRLVSWFQDEPDLSRFVFADQCFINENFPNFHVASYKYNAVKTLRSAHPATWNMEDWHHADGTSNAKRAKPLVFAQHHSRHGYISNLIEAKTVPLRHFPQRVMQCEALSV
ncbi:hypothetical protein DYB28_012095, partial [Aphanomyces astaci]